MTETRGEGMNQRPTRGDRIGGHYGITDNTRRIVVKELENLRDEVLASSKAADEVLQDRIDEIKGAAR